MDSAKEGMHLFGTICFRGVLFMSPSCTSQPVTHFFMLYTLSVVHILKSTECFYKNRNHTGYTNAMIINILGCYTHEKTLMLQLNPTTSMISLLLHLECGQWGLSGFYSSALIYHVFIKTMLWNACKYVQSNNLICGMYTQLLTLICPRTGVLRLQPCQLYTRCKINVEQNATPKNLVQN